MKFRFCSKADTHKKIKPQTWWDESENIRWWYMIIGKLEFKYLEKLLKETK